jgi:hypothetical protein
MSPAAQSMRSSTCHVVSVSQACAAGAGCQHTGTTLLTNPAQGGGVHAAPLTTMLQHNTSIHITCPVE